jgi:predicted Zn-dependent peptidase
MRNPDGTQVSFHTYADVGAADEPLGVTGLAHLLEHCAFKGTAQLGTLPDGAKTEQAVLDQCDAREAPCPQSSASRASTVRGSSGGPERAAEA